MQEQVGALETQALLGHESLTTMRYSKVTSRKASERARKAQEALRKAWSERRLNVTRVLGTPVISAPVLSSRRTASPT